MTVNCQHLIDLERLFSSNGYDGKGRLDIVIESGRIPVMVSAPHSVNHNRDGAVKVADRFTGGIARYLHESTGCHAIYPSKKMMYDPNYDPFEDNDYQKRLGKYVKDNDIRLLIDIHGSLAERENAIELGTVDDNDASLCGHDFIGRFINDVFLFDLSTSGSEKKDVWKNRNYSAGKSETVTKNISSRFGIPTIQIEINGQYRDPLDNAYLAECIIGSLEYIINTISKVDWDAKTIDSFRVKGAKEVLPKNKIEFIRRDGCEIVNGDIFDLHSDTKVTIGARARLVDDQGQNDDGYLSDTVHLANFLIEQVYGKKLEDCVKRPIIVCSSSGQTFDIGVPKSDMIDAVRLSSALYDQIKGKVQDNYLILFNRYSDSHMLLDPNIADYGDKGRVVSSDGTGRKVMIPLFFKTLLGCASYPLPMIREEEYWKILDSLDEEQRRSLNSCYEKANVNPYYVLKKDADGDDVNDVARIQSKLGLNKRIDLVCVPKNYFETDRKVELIGDSIKALKRTNKGLKGKIGKLTGLFKKGSENAGDVEKAKKKRYDGINNRIAKFFVGESEHMMSTTWSNTIDDRNNVARMNKIAMGLLGVLENDVILVKYKGHEQILKVLEWDNLEDHQISLPSACRKLFEMNNMNDIVRVKRYAIHTFKRKTHAQVLAVLGGLVAAFRIFDDVVISILLCLALIPIALYFILIEERVRVK